MSKRIGLRPAQLVITMERRPDDGNVGREPRDPAHDMIELQIWRDELRVISTEVARNEALECGDDELSLDEQAQVSAALIAEWLDWKIEPTCPECHMTAQHKLGCGRRGVPIAEPPPRQQIADVFEALRLALEVS